MAYIIELIKKQCKSCETETWLFPKSPEEYENYQCKDCQESIEQIKELPAPDNSNPDPVINLQQ